MRLYAMPQPSQSQLLDEVWQYPLFDALYGRRSRRFGRGFEVAEGPFQYKSEHPPVPLSEIEEALLVAAGVGFSGMALWDQARPLPYPITDGRTFPSTSRGRRTALFFTNDKGVFVIDPAGGSASRLRAIEGPDDRPKILALYRDHRRELKSGRLAIPRRVPPLSGHNLWASNMPGATLFMPVCDVSLSLISLIAQFVDGRLERFAPQRHRGMNIVDDRHGFRPAGTEKWLKSGFLDEEQVLPLSVLERQACYFTFSEPAMICQNMFLATEALGIGGWMHCGFLSAEIFAALGFRTAIPSGPMSLANPIGLDGIFEACCPPYYPSMDAAVDAVVATLTHQQSPLPEQPAPYLASPLEHCKGTVEITEEGIACTKAVCNYIYRTYGRFPGTVDAMHLMWLMQAHHLDTEFYDECYYPGAYGPSHAAHMAKWHP
jgi:hypothetical protein